MATRRGHLYESASFWALLGGAVAVIGLGLMAVGVAQEVATPHPDLWANWWFRVGFGVLVAGAVMLLWALILFLASRRGGPGGATIGGFQIGTQIGDIHNHYYTTEAAPPAEVTAPQIKPKETPPSRPPDEPLPSDAWLQERSISNRSLRLVDLPLEEGAIRHRTFENCVIHGPAIMIPVASTFDRCAFGIPPAGIDAILWPTMGKTFVVGAIGVVGCLFTNCRFEGVGYGGASDALEEFKAKLGFGK